MERMNGFHGYRKHAKSRSSSALNIALVNDSNYNSTTNPGGGGGGGGGGDRPQNARVIREQDQYMPIANVMRIMRRILPSHAKISDDAKETIQDCVSKYISFITGEANDRCQREQRKTVTAEDVLWAMAKLGFDDYVEPLTVFLNRYRGSEGERANLGRPEPFLRRGGSGSSGGGGGVGMMEYGVAVADAANQFNIGGVRPYGPGFNLGTYPGPGTFDAMGGYFPDGSGAVGLSGGSSSQTIWGGYDPFGQFK